MKNSCVFLLKLSGKKRVLNGTTALSLKLYFHFCIVFVHNYHFVLYFGVISSTTYGEIYFSYKRLLIYE